MMNARLSYPRQILIPFMLMTFVVCGATGMFCPMPSDAAQSRHSPPASHHMPSPQQNDCPDQLTEAGAQLKKETPTLFALSTAPTFSSLFERDISLSSSCETFPHRTSYPLRFLLFSVFRN